MEKVNLDTWSRSDTFHHFFNVAKSTYSITVKVDVTKVVEYTQENQLKFYPVMTWIVSKAINEHKQFKMGFDANNNLGFYEAVHPQFPVMDSDNNVISLTTDYDDSLLVFYDKMISVMDAYEENGTIPPDKENIIMISTLPWIHYENFVVNNESGYHFLFPMVTWGKYEKEDKVIKMPLTIQISHAVADGYHCALFFDSVNRIIDSIRRKI